jgi:hypothetical protein
MNNSRLGTLPNTRPWQRIVSHNAEGASAAVVAGATSAAAVGGLERGRFDPTFAGVASAGARGEQPGDEYRDACD